MRQPTREGGVLPECRYLARSGISQISLSQSLSQLVQKKTQWCWCFALKSTGNLPSTPVSFGDESPVSAHLLKRGRRTSCARPRNVAAPDRGLHSGYAAVSNVVNRAGVRLLRRRTLFGLFMAGPALYHKREIDVLNTASILRPQLGYLSLYGSKP